MNLDDRQGSIGRAYLGDIVTDFEETLRCLPNVVGVLFTLSPLSVQADANGKIQSICI